MALMQSLFVRGHNVAIDSGNPSLCVASGQRIYVRFSCPAFTVAQPDAGVVRIFYREASSVVYVGECTPGHPVVELSLANHGQLVYNEFFSEFSGTTDTTQMGVVEGLLTSAPQLP